MPLQTLQTLLYRIYTILAIWHPTHQATRHQTLQTKTTLAITALETENWPALQQLFLPILRLLLTETLLRKSWSLVRTIYGPLESIGPATYANYYLIQTATAPLHFKHTTVSLVLQWIPTGHLIGLRAILSAQTWTPPAYSNPQAFTAVNLTLGRGFANKVSGILTLPNPNPDPNPNLTPTYPPKAKPRAPTPCIILLPGSGPTDRDSTISALKPFKDIAHGIATAGVAVVRFDKITYAHRLWLGVLRRGRTMTMTDEYVHHVLDAVRQVRGRGDIGEVFLLGHSLGAWPAGKIAASEAVGFAGCVLMGCPAEMVYWCAVRQMRYLAGVNGEDQVRVEEEVRALERKARRADALVVGEEVSAGELPFGVGARYWLESREFHPLGYARELAGKPVLVLQGGRDYQVTVEDDYRRLREGLGGYASVEFRVYEELNHLFVAGEGLSTPAEYGKGGNVDGRVVEDIVAWVRRQTVGG
ncbi:alpha/beta-hydrolase [Aspergillus ellipticus CBS 707.79]|uniref:Alpha/beta-hydrolase n=1 Tax=Aspergillus ellipticus CBS 707.79 TaxID=1448320 RepID=A0A319DPF0_9EURO|nr:alpha/beta-hydrolase [Aspergillus ellipticus CBS 707.79]